MNQNRVPAESVTVAGACLEVYRRGGRDAGAPTLIFLHEGLGCVDMWKDFPDRVSLRTGCPILVYSRQGYGRSDACSLPRPPDYLRREALDVLPALIETEAVDEHLLIGHSDGASISLIYAGAASRQGLLGIVSMAPHVFCEDISLRSIAEASKAYDSGDLRSALMKYHFENVDCAFRGWADTWLNPAFQEWNIEELLPGIAVPQLVIQGERDHYGTLAHVRSIADRSSGPVTALVLDDCGHAPHKERPDTTLDAIAGFVRQLPATSDGGPT